MDMASMRESVGKLLGIDASSKETVVAGLWSELALIVHRAETSTVASDFAVLRQQALPIVGSLVHLAEDAAAIVSPQLQEMIERLWQAHGQNAEAHDKLAGNVTDLSGKVDALAGRVAELRTIGTVGGGDQGAEVATESAHAA